MDIDNNIEEPSTAVSLYGETNDAMDDFPILKAFQEYVDKEHAKARQRMTALAIIFLSILLLVAGGLSAVILSLSSRNQALNDRLVDFAMKERHSEQPIPQPSQENAALVAMVESLKTMIQEQKTTAAANQEGPTPEQLEMERKLKAQQERIDKTAALLKAQEESIAAQKAKLREQELEAYRRKNYPEYYERLDQAKKPAAKPQATKTKTFTKKPKIVKRPAILDVVKDLDDDLEDMLEEEDIEDIETDDEDLEDFYDSESDDDEEENGDEEDLVATSDWLIPEE